MKILHVCHSYFPSIGGNQIHMRELSERMVNLGEDVTVFTTKTIRDEQIYLSSATQVNLADNEEINGVHVRRFKINHRIRHLIFKTLPKIKGGHAFCKFVFGDVYEMLHSGPICFKMIWSIIRFKPDIVMAMNSAGAQIYYCYLAKKVFKFPLVIIPTIHMSEDWACRPVMFRVLKSADLIVALTETEKEFLAGHGIDAEKIMVGGIGIDIDQEIALRKTETANNDQGAAKKDPAVAFVGRMIKGKGIATLVDAMPSVWKEIPDAKLILAGAGTKYLDIIKEKINRFDERYRGNIILKQDFANGEKKGIFKTCDVFVMASNVDSFGLVYIEAWINKKPVIACVNTPQATIIHHKENGLLVPYGDSEELAGAIIKVLKDPELRQRMGENGYNEVLNKYSMKKIVDQLRKKYYTLCGRNLN